MVTYRASANTRLDRTISLLKCKEDKAYEDIRTTPISIHKNARSTVAVQRILNDLHSHHVLIFELLVRAEEKTKLLV